MNVAIYDEDNFSSDLNCSGKIALSKVCVADGTDLGHEMQHEGAVVGRIRLASTWTPSE
jgi:hypothetical protein